ncbi:MAG: alpha/beta hydrolase [Deltaproteobacteria bacterium]|nr:alpha/beta hydrolase [Deltaproteobacteria bacterium]
MAHALRYTEVPERLRHADRMSPRVLVATTRRALSLLAAGRPSPNEDGDVEMLGEVRAIHRFVEAPGDGDRIRWHFVEAGHGEPIVFLHGLPDSWFCWHRQIEDLSRDHRVVAIDLKGYGQSQKTPGDYRHEGVAEQLVALFDVLGLDRVNLVTHDRGSVLGDWVGASHPARIRRYVRGQQHLYHFHPALAPQEAIFLDPIRGQILRLPALLVAAAYTELCRHLVATSDLMRTVREFSHPGVGAAVARYYQSSSFRKEWIDRRTRLISSWRFPVLVLQGEHDPRQPREFYEGIEGTMPDGTVAFLDAGHFFVLERPADTTRAIRDFLAR